MLGVASGVPSHRLVARLARKRARAAAQYHRLFDRVIFPTAAFRRYFEATLPLDPTRTRVVELGMDLAPWRGAASSAPPRPRRDADQPLVLCLAGTLDRVKGYATIVEAFTGPALLARDDYRLWLLGGGDTRLVAPLVTTNPNVELRGPYQAALLPELLGGVDVGLSTSRFETFHRVTREYFLAGLPVIGSHAFGIREILRHGVNGLVVDDADPVGLTQAVTRLLDDRDLLERLTAGALATPIRSLDDEAGELARLYDGVVDEARRGPSALTSARGSSRDASVAGSTC